MKLTVWLAVLLLLPVGAFADEVAKPTSEGALHFRAEIGGEKPRTVLGWFDESKGTGKGIDVVVLDLDGDGKAETRQALRKQKFDMGDGPKEFTLMQCAVEHEGAKWLLSFQDMNAYLAEGEEPSAQRFYFGYTVTKGTGMASFGGAYVNFHDSAAAALKAEPLRLGGKMTFEVSAGTQGPGALLNISVKDVGGNRLSAMQVGGKSSPPAFTLSLGGEQKQKGSAEYG